MIFKIDGGYGVKPRWATTVRNGKLTAGVVNVITPSEYKNLSNEEFYDRLTSELFVNEAIDNRKYLGDNRAEYLERAIYTCPKCGLTEWESKGNLSKCTKCGLTIEYGEDKKITGVNEQFKYSNTAEWIEGQNEFINNLPIDKFIESPAYIDNAMLKKVNPYKNKEKITACGISQAVI